MQGGKTRLHVCACEASAKCKLPASSRGGMLWRTCQGGPKAGWWVVPWRSPQATRGRPAAPRRKKQALTRHSCYLRLYHSPPAAGTRSPHTSARLRLSQWASLNRHSGRMQRPSHFAAAAAAGALLWMQDVLTCQVLRPVWCAARRVDTAQTMLPAPELIRWHIHHAAGCFVPGL